MVRSIPGLCHARFVQQSPGVVLLHSPKTGRYSLLFVTRPSIGFVPRSDIKKAAPTGGLFDGVVLNGWFSAKQDSRPRWWQQPTLSPT